MSTSRAAASTRLRATHDAFVASRPPGADEDVHMIPTIVDHIIERCSKPGNLVFDPFAGFGTTLSRAVELGRRAFGIELLPERVAHIRRRIPGARIIDGDARELLPQLQALTGQVTLILSSPPYMTVTDHDADPLTAYTSDGGTYPRYLQELEFIAQHCARLLAPGGYLVWNVADILHRGVETHLIDDCAQLLSTHLTSVTVADIEWDRLPHDLTRDALLVCQASDQGS